MVGYCCIIFFTAMKCLLVRTIRYLLTARNVHCSLHTARSLILLLLLHSNDAFYCIHTTTRTYCIRTVSCLLHSEAMQLTLHVITVQQCAKLQSLGPVTVTTSPLPIAHCDKIVTDALGSNNNKLKPK